MDVSEPGTALRAALRRLQGVTQVLRQTALAVLYTATDVAAKRRRP